MAGAGLENKIYRLLLYLTKQKLKGLSVALNILMISQKQQF